MQLTEITLLTHREELLIALTIISRTVKGSLLHTLVFAYYAKTIEIRKTLDSVLHTKTNVCVSIVRKERHLFFSGTEFH